MKRVFEKVKPDSRIIIGYSASLFLLLLVYVVTVVANTQLKERTNLVEHTYRTIFQLESLLSKIKDAETGVRGYALTHNDDFLAPYNHSEEAVDSIYSRLTDLSENNPLKLQRLQELRKVIDERFDIFRLSLTYFRNNKTDNAFDLPAMQMRSKRVMDEIRYKVAFMQKEENKLLMERDGSLKSIFASINLITLVSLLLTLLLVLIGFITYTRENKARKIALRNIEEYQEQLNRRINELNTANGELLEMRSMEKYTATGRIARTIAHEVRNPLTNIDLAVNQLKADIGGEDEALNYLFDVIDRNSNRINKLISELLQSTKFTELNFCMMPVNELLDATLAMAKDRIELSQVQVLKFYRDTPVLQVDAEKMKIALLNIIINAIEAVTPGEGTLSIETKAHDDVCVIVIRDNGAGMNPLTLSKLFEPYFTSKPNGNGLGLANTQNIIYNHNGTINVSSEPDRGSTFSITLQLHITGQNGE